ncbi:cytochrome c oxidase subunit 3 [Aureibaculum marinum]|nr:cytochrome c oxidase subunit 3 [Aureibaculum marinum]
MDAQVKSRATKQMMYVAIISMIMMFAGLTSAYVISSKREDWVTFGLPQGLYISSILIMLSSVSYYLAKKNIHKNNRALTTIFLILTLVLAVGFVAFQVKGFNQLREVGLYFTGEGSVVSSSMLVVISFAHLLHVAAGLIVLLVVLINHLRHKYKPNDALGLEVGGIFWHFVDVLWIFLFLFFYFIT